MNLYGLSFLLLTPIYQVSFGVVFSCQRIYPNSANLANRSIASFTTDAIHGLAC